MAIPAVGLLCRNQWDSRYIFPAHKENGIYEAWVEPWSLCNVKEGCCCDCSGVGIITTVAGNGDLDFSGDGGLATEAGLRDGTAVAMGSDGRWVTHLKNMFPEPGSIRRRRRFGLQHQMAGLLGQNVPQSLQ